MSEAAPGAGASAHARARSSSAASRPSPARPIRAVSPALRRADRLGRIQRHRLRQFGDRRPHQPLRRFHRSVLRDDRAGARLGLASRRPAGADRSFAIAGFPATQTTRATRCSSPSALSRRAGAATGSGHRGPARAARRGSVEGARRRRGASGRRRCSMRSASRRRRATLVATRSAAARPSASRPSRPPMIARRAGALSSVPEGAEISARLPRHAAFSREWSLNADGAARGDAAAPANSDLCQHIAGDLGRPRRGAGLERGAGTRRAHSRRRHLHLCHG